MASGYKLLNGADLSTIFAARTSVTSVVTGYKLLNGDDLSSLYEPGVSTGVTTGYKLQNTENDIATVFLKKSSLSPLDISGCCYWMDASDQSTIDLSSGKVSKWTDKSVNRYTMNQIDHNKRPTYNEFLNGLPVLKFSSTDLTYLVGDSSANAFVIGTRCYSLFAVCKQSSSRGGYVFAKSKYGPGGGRLFFGRDTSLYCYVIHPDGGSLPLIADSNVNYRILELVINRVSGNDYVYQNGTQIGTYTYTPDRSTPITELYTMLIGAYNNASGGEPVTGGANLYLDGNIAEIVAVANTYDMTTARRQWIEGYLAWKWGLQTLLSGTHPYYNNAPTGPPPS